MRGQQDRGGSLGFAWACPERHPAKCWVVQQELVHISSRDCNNMQNKSSFPLDLHLFCRWCSLIYLATFHSSMYNYVVWSLEIPYSVSYIKLTWVRVVLLSSSETSVHTAPTKSQWWRSSSCPKRMQQTKCYSLYSWWTIDSDCTGNEWLLIETCIASQQRISYNSLLQGGGRTESRLAHKIRTEPPPQ